MSIVTLVGSQDLKLGAVGPVVEAVQLGLRGLGYALKGTGYYGPATEVAVSTFQKRAGLQSDGVFGPGSARALDAATQGTPLPPAAQAEVSRPLWLEAGLKLLGTKEGAGGADNPLILDWAKEEGGDIAQSYTHDSIPWCALFANHILTHVGLKGTETLWALDFAGKWPSVKLDGPAVGAFAPMLRNGGGHIICVAGRAKSGNVMGLGGNQSDAVTLAEFPLSRLNKGFWYPAGVTLPAVTGLSTLPLIQSNGRLSGNEA
jgi:uncharacterized protein (TIGR02594 family)